MADRTPTQTLDALLDAWRETKAPALAQLIATYSLRSESSDAGQLRSKAKLSQPDWLAALRDGESIDRGAVLVHLASATSGQVVDRITILAELDPDPRIVDALHAMIEAVPWTSTSARKVWTRTFRLLEQLADPRTREFARSFDAGRIQVWSESAGPWMAERLTKLADALAELPTPEPTPTIQQWIDELGRDQPIDGAPNPITVLLEAAMQNPDDLDARLVLADALSDRGDPQGELIRVQIARETTPRARELVAREKQLLADNRDRLLGTLAPIARRSGLEFERGFVSACTLEPLIHTHLLEAALADERIATLRRVRAPLAFVLGSRLRSLREVDVIPQYEQSMEPLLRCPRILPFVSLDCRIQPGDDELLDGCVCLPALDRLGLSGNSAQLIGAGTRELARRVSNLHFQTKQAGDLGPLLGLATARSIGSVSVANAGVETNEWRVNLSLARDRAEPGLDATLTVSLAGTQGPRPALEFTTAALAAIRSLSIATLEIRSSKPIRDQAVRDRLRATVAAQVADIDAVRFDASTQAT